MSRFKLTGFILLTLVIISALAWGIFLGDPQDMRIEASGL